MDFRLHAWRFTFRAAEPVHFPEGKSGNVLRGTFGWTFRRLACVPECTGARDCPARDSCAYARIFEPRCEEGPSGLADSPRPFVFRAAHLDGHTVPAGAAFNFDLHIFDTTLPVLPYFVRSFAEAATEGFGPGHGRSRLLGVNDALTGATLFDGRQLQQSPEPLVLALNGAATVRRLRVSFLTATELKGSSLPDFGALFARARDRVSTLRQLYGEGPLELDFRGMGERARAVRLIAFDRQDVRAERRSSRTGQTHPLGGFTGVADYEGDCGEFVPILRAAEWTGVGRQTVWGKGAIRVEAAG
jgi:hypothetical protein